MNNNENFTKIKVNKYLVMILLMLVSVVGFFLLYEGKVRDISENKSYMEFICDNEDSNLGEIEEDTKIEQTFKAKSDFKGISIRFSTYARENQGEINAKLIEIDNNEEIEEWNIDIKDLQDNSYYAFYLDTPIYNCYGKEYKIVLDLKGLYEDNSITLTSSMIDQYKDGELYINGEKQNQDLCIATISLNSNFLKYIYLLISVVFTIFIGSIYYLIFIRKAKIENIFLVSAICLGLTCLFLQTPYSSYDEPAHINTAYRYSNKLLGINNSIFNGPLPKRVVDNYSGLSYGPTTISTYKTVAENLFSKVDETGSQLIPMSSTKVSEAPYIYLPSVVGITIARILNLGQIPLLMLGKIFNLAFFIAACYFAIKKMPFAKILLFVVALLPMNLSQNSTFSYDSVITGLAYLFTAYCLSIAFGKEEVNKKDLIIFFIITLLLTPLKKVYVLICFIALIIPKNRFRDIKKYRVFLITLICSIGIFYLAINAIEAVGVVTEEHGVSAFSQAESYTVRDIINTPLLFSKILINSIWNHIHGFIYYGVMAFYQVPTNQMLTFIYIVLLLLSTIKTKDEEVYLKFGNKLWIGMLISTIMVALFVAGFTWTVKGETIIQGVQGRYMLPFLPFALLLARNSNLVLNKNIDKGLMFTISLCEVVTLVNVFVSVIAYS